MEEPPTFEQNFSNLLCLKQELIQLQHRHSKHFINSHQTRLTASLQLKLQQTRQYAISLETKINQSTLQAERDTSKLQKQLRELIEINQRLVLSNESSNRQLARIGEQNQELRKELANLKANLTGIEHRFEKEMTNTKLIHAQELYILRKKEKKIS